MIDRIGQVLKEGNIFSYKNCGVLICRVESEKQGFDLVSLIFKKIVDKRSVVYLSGGKTPRSLYERWGEEEWLSAGACGMVDERFGEKWHKNSNELMMRGCGLLRYLETRDIPFYPVLQVTNEDRGKIARLYDAKMRELLSVFPKHVGFLGIGADGHTAGIPAGGVESEKKTVSLFSGSDLVVGFDDDGVKYGERVTMTFTGLSMLDFCVVLALGKEKRQALGRVFADGNEMEVPARFYKRPAIAGKTVLITDQELV